MRTTGVAAATLRVPRSEGGMEGFASFFGGREGRQCGRNILDTRNLGIPIS